MFFLGGGGGHVVRGWEGQLYVCPARAGRVPGGAARAGQPVPGALDPAALRWVLPHVPPAVGQLVLKRPSPHGEPPTHPAQTLRPPPPTPSLPATQGCMKSGQVLTDKRWKWFEPEHWRFGDPTTSEGRINYPRHASGGSREREPGAQTPAVVGPAATGARSARLSLVQGGSSRGAEGPCARCSPNMLPKAPRLCLVAAPSSCPSCCLRRCLTGPLTAAPPPPPGRPAVRRVRPRGAVHRTQRGRTAPLC